MKVEACDKCKCLNTDRQLAYLSVWDNKDEKYVEILSTGFSVARKAAMGVDQKSRCVSCLREEITQLIDDVYTEEK